MPTSTILAGDCRAVLPTLAAGSVNCAITSPPYWGLRQYGDAPAGEIGGEATLAEYIAALVEVFQGVRRVLRDDGTLWLNIGDAYAGSWGARGRGEGTNAPRPDWEAKHGTAAPARNPKAMGLKPKDLIGLPWRVAFALQADGWYLRSDIIWAKPNPMPESIRDRPSKAHEYLFMFAKSERYYYDHEAVKEDAVSEHGSGNGFKRDAQISRDGRGNDTPWAPTEKRSRRTVWTVPVRPFDGDHRATYPPELIEPCVLAGCPLGGVVIDPFSGAGTTGLVANRHGRDYIGVELYAKHVALAQERIAHDSLLFNQAG